MAGLAVYFALPHVFEKCYDKIEAGKHQSQEAIRRDKEIFLEEQLLRRRYRYIKLGKKDNIINSDIDKKDKILLLEIIHGCSPEEASMLLQKNM